MVKIAIIQYSTFGHVTVLARAIQQGVESEGGQADIFQIPETLNDEVLTLIHAPPKPSDIPTATLDTLVQYDAFLFGFPTRYGTVPSQFSAFWDATGPHWAKGTLHGKPYGLFVSTGSPGGGQEVTFRNSLSSFSHHGMVFIPLGYGKALGLLTNDDEPHGGSPWGAGTYAGGDGSRQPSELELSIAREQGSYFFSKVRRFGSSFVNEDASVPSTITITATTITTATATTPTDKKEDNSKAKVRQSQSTATTNAVSEKTGKGSSKCCVVM